jgi:hypothetical protein
LTDDVVDIGNAAKKMGLYLLQKRYNAVFIALFLAFLPSIGLPTFSVAAIIVALVTLHKGLKEGFFVLSFVLLPSIIAVFSGTAPTMFFVQTITEGIVLCLIASVLATTASWMAVMQAIVGIGIVSVLAVQLIFPDITSWWLLQLSAHMSSMQSTLNIDLPPAQLKVLIERASHFATGVSAAGILTWTVVLLLAARAWQAILFNPGGLRKEWCILRLSYRYSICVFVVLLLLWLGMAWLVNILPVLLVPFIFAGTSLVYGALPEKKNTRILALIAFYGMLLLFLPYFCMLLILLAFADSCYDFRAARAKKT